MIEALLLSAMYVGAPVPEWLGRSVAERVELLDHRQEWETEVVTYRIRHSRGLPRVSEAWTYRMDDPMMRQLQWQHILWLQRRIEMEYDRPAIQEEYRRWLKEAEKLRDFWGYITTAQLEYVYLWQRRESLRSARDMVGPAHWGVDTPDYLPFWRFRDDG